MRYVSNRKHREPWQHGKRGTLCPKEVWSHAQKLLDESVSYARHRYAIFDGIPYKGQRNDNSAEDWHGYPVGIMDVPSEVIKVWLDKGLITNRMIKKLRRT